MFKNFTLFLLHSFLCLSVSAQTAGIIQFSIAAPLVIKTSPVLTKEDFGEDRQSEKSAESNDSAATEFTKAPWWVNSYVVFSEAMAVLCLLGLLLWRTKNLKKQKKQFKDLSEKHTGIKNQLTEVTNQYRVADANLLEAYNKIELLEEQLKSRLKRDVMSIEDTTESTAVIDAPVLLPNPISYARYADLGDGFSAKELLDFEDDETIFEIKTLSTHTAEYRVSENIAAQKHALANAAYFLSKTCNYDEVPSGYINTIVPGELRLEGNKWLIRHPAKITFK